MKTKELIVETAKELISQVGYHKTTTASLAKAANISEGTIYRHFESKEDILVTILKELDAKYQDFVERLRAAGEQNCSVENVLARHFQFVDENAADIRIMLVTYKLIDSARVLVEAIVSRLRNFFVECMRRQRERGELRDVPEDETSWILVLLLFALSRAKLYWPEMGDLAEEAVNFCHRSLTKK